MAETLVMGFAGEAGRMKDAPRYLISQSLPRVLEDATPEVMKQIEGYAYPVMLIVGVGAYGLDVWRQVSVQNEIAREEQQRAAARVQRAEPLPQPQAQPPAAAAPSNGAGPEMVIAAGGGQPGGMDDLKSHDGRDFIEPRTV